MTSRLPAALQALLDTGWGLARRSSSFTVVLARLEAVVDPEGLPDEVRERAVAELRRAVQETCTPLAHKDVERLLKDAWGQAPGKVLDDLDREPLAVRPATQLHLAEHDGRRVVVKVRRPGLEVAVRADLALLDALAGPLRAVVPQADTGALLREVRERALDELDLEHEAGAQRQVGRALRRLDGVVVPAPVTDLAAPGVLVSEHLDGRTMAEGARPDDPVAAARALLAAGAVAVRGAGLAPADAKPGHVVVRRDGTLGLLGTGLAAPVPAERLDHALDALAALRADDPAAFARAAGPAGLGVLPEAAARRAHDLLRELGGDLVQGPAVLDAARLRRLAEDAADRAGELLALAGEVTPQAGDAWAARALGQLAALLARLGAKADWSALALEAARP